MDLEQVTREIRELKRNLGQNLWMLGNRLNLVKEEKLFLTKYGMFEEYLEKEVDLDRSTAYRYMQIARDFDENLVQEWGAKKCNLLISLKEPVRQEILQVHKPTDSFETVRQTVQRLRQEETVTEEIDYFVYTEDILFETLNKIKLCKDHIYGCNQKEGFANFPRKQRIMDLWKQVQQEVNDGNNARLIAKMED